jgi:hypothetical protein
MNKYLRGARPRTPQPPRREPGIIRFLQTKTSREDLATALRVLREFKACENDPEWFEVPFEAWAKLEQLEEFLAHLVDGEALMTDTLQELIRHRIDAATLRDRQANQGEQP